MPEIIDISAITSAIIYGKKEVVQALILNKSEYEDLKPQFEKSFSAKGLKRVVLKDGTALSISTNTKVFVNGL